MNTPLKAIVSNDGLTASPVNPYPYNYDHDIYPSVEYSDFENSNPSLPLSTPQQPGTEILVRQVWQQYHFYLSGDWYTIPEPEIKEDIHREAYQPIALPEQDKGETKTTKDMEKEIYFKLSDNADLNGLYLASMDDVKEHILMDIGDVHPGEVEQLEYTITIVKMTQEEFDNLPEYEG